MQRPFYWILFLSLLGMIVIGYSGRTLFHIWQMVRLDSQTVATHVQWSVNALSDEDYVLLASYHFNSKGKTYQNQTQWQDHFLNEWTANEAISRQSKKPLEIWFDSSQPAYSSAQKYFPFKEVIYSFLLWMIGIYFVMLGNYAQKSYGSK